MVPIAPYLSRSEADTEAWARSFAQGLRAGDVVELHGNLGAGKTVLARGLARGLGFAGHVHSPSYALVHEYPGGRLAMFHMDLYRLAQGADWEEIGLEHYFQQGGVCVVEWAERLPANRSRAYRIEIAAEGENERRIKVMG